VQVRLHAIWSFEFLAAQDGSCAPPEREVTGKVLYRFAEHRDLPLLARLNRQLIQDERADNPMTLFQLEERMRRWLASQYRAVLFEEGSQTVGYAVVSIGRRGRPPAPILYRPRTASPRLRPRRRPPSARGSVAQGQLGHSGSPASQRVRSGLLAGDRVQRPRTNAEDFYVRPGALPCESRRRRSVARLASRQDCPLRLQTTPGSARAVCSQSPASPDEARIEGREATASRQRESAG